MRHRILLIFFFLITSLCNVDICAMQKPQPKRGKPDSYTSNKLSNNYIETIPHGYSFDNRNRKDDHKEGTMLPHRKDTEIPWDLNRPAINHDSDEIIYKNKTGGDLKHKENYPNDDNSTIKSVTPSPWGPWPETPTPTPE